MEEAGSSIQFVTFKLGKETYAIDIMDVNEIVQEIEVRPIPGAPSYVEGLLNLRGTIIPIINLHERFQLEKAILDEDEELYKGYIIITINGKKLGIIIDKIAKVMTVNTDLIQSPPQMMSGIGSEYIQGVVNTKDEYLICLNIRKIFNPSELKQLNTISK
jgi:purine-binding chemotaxis protein CheW